MSFLSCIFVLLKEIQKKIPLSLLKSPKYVSMDQTAIDHIVLCIYPKVQLCKWQESAGAEDNIQLTKFYSC